MGRRLPKEASDAQRQVAGRGGPCGLDDRLRGVVRLSNTSYGYSGYPSSYYSQPAYYPQPTYYQSAPVATQTRYVPVPVTTPAARPHHLRDSDHDGIPDRTIATRTATASPTAGSIELAGTPYCGALQAKFVASSGLPEPE